MANEEKPSDGSSKETAFNKPVVFILLLTTLFSFRVFDTRVDEFLVVSPQSGMIHTTYIPFFHEFPNLASLFTTFIPYTFISGFFFCVGHYFGDKTIILGGFCFVALLPPFVRTSWYFHSHILYTIAISIQPFCLLPLIGARQLFSNLYKVNGLELDILSFITYQVAISVNRRIYVPPEWENLVMFSYSLISCLLFHFYLPDSPGTSERPTFVEFGPELTGFVGSLLVNFYWIYYIDIIDEEKVYTMSAICVVLDFLFYAILWYEYPWSWWSRRKESDEGIEGEVQVS
ncbi:hypothetical protein CA3LBN_000004 [Candidozyma haemuli]|uniref:Uncharacterized protein n=1 Tax=Candidozyma haemuli TaxID=45357 RepID=A0ABX8HYQ3_9ASCO|nr:hypothetical protein CA3LBN_000004 [[Candida] haemuloni]